MMIPYLYVVGLCVNDQIPHEVYWIGVNMDSGLESLKSVAGHCSQNAPFATSDATIYLAFIVENVLQS